MKALRIALALGFLIDGFVGLISLFAPGLLKPLFDLPVKEMLTAQIAGGEFIVVALVYAVAFANPVRFRPLLWLCAVDQAFAVLLPALGIAHGAVPATWKVLAPIPLSALLAALYAAYAVRLGRKRSATPFMQ